MGSKGRATELACKEYLQRALKLQWRVHVKHCSRCITQAAARRRYCDEGWLIVSELTAVNKQVRDLKARAEADRPTLF